ncbi:efflux transporter periplasmic adaptor subunit [Orrella marina]|uniref:Efflux transporter periplasmic adaptor subunit n=1 Tax=Orrella marina TaxID=2163011 RepID=A0A2R4XGM0_9BURK|nr:efflux transporter periplasmic adaptor subunit [Orrella marina]
MNTSSSSRDTGEPDLEPTHTGPSSAHASRGTVTNADKPTPPSLSGRILRRLVPYVVTLALVMAAGWLVWEVWYLYMRTPWTRDAFVRVEVTEVAPEGVSGYVTELPIAENQWVDQGELLLRIDPTRYQLTVNQVRSELEVARVTAQMDRDFAQSRVTAGDAVSSEETQAYQTRARASELEVERLEAALALVQFNLDRTRLYAPVSGYVTNLNLRQGNFLGSGQTAVILLDASSFWVEAYFQETHLADIQPGAKAAIDLMAYDRPLTGTVVSVSKGIANPNNNPGYLGLQSVDPVDAWVRLAQRIPVYVRIDEIPDDLPLSAGMTAAVAVGEAAQQVLNPVSLSDRLRKWLGQRL